VARLAAGFADDIETRWLLNQARTVRLSCADAVLGCDDERVREIWMLRQPDVVRESYIREVLQGAPESPRTTRQTDRL
jgi:hypothetical protein